MSGPSGWMTFGLVVMAAALLIAVNPGGP